MKAAVTTKQSTRRTALRTPPGARKLLNTRLKQEMQSRFLHTSEMQITWINTSEVLRGEPGAQLVLTECQ